MIRVVAATGSTNADLLVAVRSGAVEGSWLRAERQTGGRGRADRLWASPPGNLYASTVVRLRGGDPAAPGLALVAGVALQEVAAAYVAGPQLRLKWPNDLLVGDAKLAGILLEREGDAVVIGFGVNLVRHPVDAGRPATDLAALSGSAPDPDSFMLDLSATLARWLGRWRSDGLAPVRRRWLERAHPVGSAIATTGPLGRIEGLFDGLEPDGALRLRQAHGDVQIVRAGDVHLI